MFQSEVKQLRLLTKKQAIKQKGYSIIELSIALAIISIILVTSLAGVQRVLRSNNVNNDLRNINLLAARGVDFVQQFSKNWLHHPRAWRLQRGDAMEAREVCAANFAVFWVLIFFDI